MTNGDGWCVWWWAGREERSAGRDEWRGLTYLDRSRHYSAPTLTQGRSNHFRSRQQRIERRCLSFSAGYDPFARAVATSDSPRYTRQRPHRQSCRKTSSRPHHDAAICPVTAGEPVSETEQTVGQAWRACQPCVREGSVSAPNAASSPTRTGSSIAVSARCMHGASPLDSRQKLWQVEM